MPRGSLALCLLFGTAACSTGSGDVPCVTVTTDCQPAVNPPTFDALYANIFKPSCATGSGNCHGDAASAGLSMTTVDGAYAGLSARSMPSDLGCSLVLKRLESGDADYRMPPGPTPLSDPQRCAVRKWIADGAKR